MWDRFILPVKAVEALITATLIWACIVVVLDFGREIIAMLINSVRNDDPRK